MSCAFGSVVRYPTNLMEPCSHWTFTSDDVGETFERLPAPLLDLCLGLLSLSSGVCSHCGSGVTARL